MDFSYHVYGLFKNFCTSTLFRISGNFFYTLHNTAYLLFLIPLNFYYAFDHLFYLKNLRNQSILCMIYIVYI